MNTTCLLLVTKDLAVERTMQRVKSRVKTPVADGIAIVVSCLWYGMVCGIWYGTIRYKLLSRLVSMTLVHSQAIRESEKPRATARNRVNH